MAPTEVSLIHLRIPSQQSRFKLLNRNLNFGSQPGDINALKLRNIHKNLKVKLK